MFIENLLEARKIYFGFYFDKNERGGVEET